MVVSHRTMKIPASTERSTQSGIALPILWSEWNIIAKFSQKRSCFHSQSRHRDFSRLNRLSLFSLSIMLTVIGSDKATNSKAAESWYFCATLPAAQCTISDNHSCAVMVSCSRSAFIHLTVSGRTTGFDTCNSRLKQSNA